MFLKIILKVFFKEAFSTSSFSMRGPSLTVRTTKVWKITQKELLAKGQDVRVVSMPSMELFDQQSDEYKESVLPRDMRKRLSIEMSSDFGWHKYVGLDGKTLSVNKFGASAPAAVVIENYGFTLENVVNTFLSM